MRTEYSIRAIIFSVVAVLSVGMAVAAEPKDDVFKGKLFAPNIILENQTELGLSKDQFTAIRAAVVEVQGNVAEHEWDMREAYLLLMAELDKSPIDEDKVVAHASKAMLAENEVKKNQVLMLVRLKNLLTEEQIAYLESVHGK
jgi:hypothetical protein